MATNLKIDKSDKHDFPKTEQQWVTYINKLHRSALNERQSLEAQWARSIAYYWGFQHLIYDPIIRLLSVDPDRNNEYIINRTAAVVEQRVAKIIRAKPILTVIPDKNDPKIIKAAELSEKLFKQLWKQNRKDDKLHLTVLLMVLMGSSFQKTIWDVKGGEPVRHEHDDEGNLVFDEKTGMQKSHLVYMGDIATVNRTGWEILASRGATTIQNAEWIMERVQRPVLEVKAMFEEKYDENKIQHRWDEMTRFEKFIYSLGCPALGSYGFGYDRADYEDDVEEDKIILVKEFWMKPNYVYPEGVLATVTGDNLLQFDTWPYDHKKFPFIKFDEHKNPFGFYGLSTVTRMIPIQQHYNQCRTQMARNAELMSNVKWWVPKGSGLSEDSLTDEEGEIVETNGNMSPPQQLGVAPLPNYVIQSMQQDLEDMRDVTGERSIDQAPFANLTAGVAIETMAELADISLSPVIRNVEQAIIEGGRQELQLANQFYAEERFLKELGPEKGKLAVVTFKAEDLAHQCDLTVQIESGLGYTKATARQNLMDMWDRRIITDPDLLIKAYSTGNIDLVIHQKDPAEAIVIQDIEDAKNGKQPPVSPYDNHVLFIKMLSAFVQTPEFRKLPPDRQQIIAMTLQAHIQAMQPQQPTPEQNPAAVGTPFGEQVTGPEMPLEPGQEGLPTPGFPGGA